MPEEISNEAENGETWGKGTEYSGRPGQSIPSPFPLIAAARQHCGRNRKAEDDHADERQSEIEEKRSREKPGKNQKQDYNEHARSDQDSANDEHGQT